MRSLENSELHPKATQNRLLSPLIKGKPQHYTSRMLSRLEEMSHRCFPPGFQSSTSLGKDDPIQRKNFTNPARRNKSRRNGISFSLEEQHTQHTCRHVITASRCLYHVGEWVSRLRRCKRQWEIAEEVPQTGEWESAGLSGAANLWSSFLYGKMCQPSACQKEGPQNSPDLRPKVRERKAKKTKASRRDL